MAAKAEVTHRALDGSRFIYSGTVDLTHPATSDARVMIGEGLKEFTSGPAWVGERVAEHRGIRLDKAFVMQAGQLRIGQTATYDDDGKPWGRVLMAVWCGQRYCLFTHAYDVGIAETIAMIDALRITEQPDGIVIEPRREAPARFEEPASSAKYVPGLGVLDARVLDKRAVAALPSWQGARMPAGELFQDTLSNGDPYLVLATSTAVVTIVPLADVPFAEAARLAGSLGVTVR